MNKNLDHRLQELGINDLYGFRLELKPLGTVLKENEVLNCVVTGLINGVRQLLAITDSRIILVNSGVLRQGEITVIKGSGVKSWKFNKKFLLSSIEIETSEKIYIFKNTQRRIASLFDRAMKEINKNE
ncbi:MAG: PH domain-containing protein [Sphaerochaetaceae bacterium]|nr:PH domain-containing protein [Sphaerochaetaceae bacterium]